MYLLVDEELFYGVEAFPAHELVALVLLEVDFVLHQFLDMVPVELLHNFVIFGRLGPRGLLGLGENPVGVENGHKTSDPLPSQILVFDRLQLFFLKELKFILLINPEVHSDLSSQKLILFAYLALQLLHTPTQRHAHTYVIFKV